MVLSLLKKQKAKIIKYCKINKHKLTLYILDKNIDVAIDKTMEVTLLFLYIAIKSGTLIRRHEINGNSPNLLHK